MVFLRDLAELRRSYHLPVLTIGNFDGLHLGHQALVGLTMERARAIGGTSMVMTFEPHPMRVLRPAVNIPIITPLEQKLELLEELGVDVVICARFDERFARLTADEFVDKLLVGRINVAEVVVGYDFRFGHKGLGDIELLEAKGEAWGFKVHVVGPVMVDGLPVSSTRVRQEVRAGRMEEARRLLGRPYRIVGYVVPGRGRGARVVGFPTANLRVGDELIPKPGVYAVMAEVEGYGKMGGVTNIGTNPTFDDGAMSIETHLLDFSGDIYGKRLVVHFLSRLRDEIRFRSVQELTAQISRDIAKAREVLAEEGV